MNRTFDGVVIREQQSGENGKTLSVLTENDGVVRVSASGARKITASYLKSAQLFAYSHMTVYDKNGHLTLTEAELIEGFYYIRKDLLSLAFASYACELAYLAAVPLDGSMLRLLLNALYAVSNSLAPVPVIKAVYELKLCCVSGLTPDMGECSVCGGTPDGFDLAACEPRCFAHRGNAGDFSPLRASARELVAYVCRAELPKMLSFRASRETLDDFRPFCERYMIFAAELNPATLAFYKEISERERETKN